MTSGTKNWIIVILSVIILAGVFFLGYSRYPHWHPCKQTTNDTIYLTDTVTHHIVDSFPWYIVRKDTIILRDTVLKDVDTSAILKDYFAIHFYDREWNDSILSVSLSDMITENRPFENDFKYRFLKPYPTIINKIDNSINYSKYIYLGGSVTLPDVKYSNLGIYGAFSKSFYGLSYMPWQKGIMFTTGIKIIKLK